MTLLLDHDSHGVTSEPAPSTLHETGPRATMQLGCNTRMLKLCPIHAFNLQTTFSAVCPSSWSRALGMSRRAARCS